MFLAISWCLRKWVWLLPIITIVWMTASFATTYGIAVALNHTFPNFPYISYTGTEVPERGIFTFCVAVTAIMLAANAEMRFLFVKEVFKKALRKQPDSLSVHWSRTNVAGLVMGMASSLGLLLVACFQVDVLKPPHYFGAFLCFVVAIFYIWLQIAISYKVRTVYRENKSAERKIWKAFKFLLFIYQIACGIAATILLILFATSKTTYKIQRGLKMGTKWDTLRGVFLLSTTTEWLLAYSVMFFILSYIPGFKRLQKIKIRGSLDDQEEEVGMKELQTIRTEDNQALVNGVSSAEPVEA